LSLNKIIGSATWLEHGNFAFRMLIYTKTKGISIKIVNGVEMLKEGVTNEEKVFILTWKSAFMNDEVAFLMTGFVKVLLWVNLEDVIAHLETDRL
jgi:hypothetical protein